MPKRALNIVCVVAFACIVLGFGIVEWGISSQQPGPLTKTQSYEDRNKKTGDRKPDEALREWLTHDAAGFFTLWLVIIGGAQLVLFYVQLRLIRESLIDAKISADAALVSANTARDAIELSRKEFAARHRPKLILRGAFSALPAPSEEPPIVCIFTISNIGDSRAWIAQSHLDFRLCELAQLFLVPDSRRRMVIKTHGKPIDRGESREFPFMNLADKTLVWDAEHRRSYTDNDRGLFFVGHIVYLDDANVPRQLAFRRRYNPSSQRFERIYDQENEHEYAD